MMGINCGLGNWAHHFSFAKPRPSSRGQLQNHASVTCVDPIGCQQCVGQSLYKELFATNPHSLREQEDVVLREKTADELNSDAVPIIGFTTSNTHVTASSTKRCLLNKTSKLSRVAFLGCSMPKPTRVVSGRTRLKGGIVFKSWYFVLGDRLSGRPARSRIPNIHFEDVTVRSDYGLVTDQDDLAFAELVVC